jgi:hypothetical protein
VLATLGEARPDRDVRLPREHRLDEAGDLARVVLAVAVEPDGELEAVRERVLEARLHGAPDAEVERQTDDVRARRLGRRPRAVGGAVVDDHHLHPRVHGAQLLEHGGYRASLVERRHHRHSSRSRKRHAAASGLRPGSRRSHAGKGRFGHVDPMIGGLPAARPAGLGTRLSPYTRAPWSG